MKRLIVSLLHLLVCFIIYFFPFSVWKRLLVFNIPCQLRINKQVNTLLLSKRIKLLIRRSLYRSPTCLESALVLRLMLACYGVNTTCCLGIQIENEKLIAHAWVMSNDEVLGDEFPLDAYVQVFPWIKK